MADFARAFAGPALFWDDERDEAVRTEPHNVGPLSLPTGNLAIQDPGYNDIPVELDRRGRPGDGPVDLVLRSFRNEDGTEFPPLMIAAARVILGTGETERYVRVKSAGEPAVFGVDSGLMAIADRSFYLALPGRTAVLDAVPGSSPTHDRERPAAHIVPAGGGGAVFVCQAGMGDGAYRGWWGLGPRGELREIIVDFGLLEHSVSRVVEVPASALLADPATLRLALAGTGIDLEAVPAAEVGIPMHWASPDSLAFFRRPAGPHWELRLVDGADRYVGSPGHIEVGSGAAFEYFELEKLERATTLRIRIHEGTRSNRRVGT